MALKEFSLTVNSSLVSGTNTNFPGYINLALMPAGFWSTVTSDGGDIRAYSDSARTTELPVEVYAISTGGQTGEVYVKVPSLTTTTVIYLTVDGTSTMPSPSSTYGRNNVWTGYIAVQHMGTSLTDSTGNGNNGTATSASTTTGLLGSARTIDGTSGSYIDFGSAWNSGRQFTLTVLMNFTDFTTGAVSNQQYIIQKREGGTNNGMWQFYRNNSSSGTPNTLSTDIYNGSFSSKRSNSDSLSTATWYALDGSIDFTTAGASAWYRDGTSLGIGSDGTLSSLGTNSNTVRLGYSSNSGSSFKGVVDEVRMYNGVKNANWALTEANNLQNGSTFWTVADITSYVTPDLRSYFY